jgi:hypothetical protein
VLARSTLQENFGIGIVSSGIEILECKGGFALVLKNVPCEKEGIAEDPERGLVGAILK